MDLALRLSLSATLAGAVLVAPVRAFGGSTGDVTSFRISPDARRVVYRADALIDEQFRLFVVSIDGGAVLPIGPAPVVGGDVRDGFEAPFGPDARFQITPDSRTVVYRADQEQDEVVELWAGSMSVRAPVMRLSGPLVPGGGVGFFRIAPDSKHVVYLANQDDAGKVELYSATLSGDPPVKLNAPLGADGNVTRFQFSPDGRRVVYLADPTVDERFELFQVSAAGGAVTSLSAASGSVAGFDISPDGLRVVYNASGLYSVSMVGDRLTLLTERGGTFQITPESKRVVVFGPAALANRYQLSVVPIGGGPEISLTPPVYGQPADLLLSPDGRTVAYSVLADHPSSVYTVPLAGGPAQWIYTGGYVGIDGFSPDSSHVVYTEHVIPDVFSVASSGGTSTRLTDRYVRFLAFQRDSTHALCMDDIYTGCPGAIYDAPLDGGSFTQLTRIPVWRGGVVQASLSSDGARVVYVADQDVDELFELYSLPATGGPSTKLSALFARFAESR